MQIICPLPARAPSVPPLLVCAMCLKTCCCPCLTKGDINEHAGGPVGWVGGCCVFTCLLSNCCGQCIMMALDAPKIASTSGFEETPVMACVKTCIPCTSCCYTIQVARQCLIQKAAGQKPAQQEMSEALKGPYAKII